MYPDPISRTCQITDGKDFFIGIFGGQIVEAFA
jgi:hypothetical protein